MTREYFTNEFLKHIQTTDSIMSTRGYKELCQEVLDTRAEIDMLIPLMIDLEGERDFWIERNKYAEKSLKTECKIVDTLRADLARRDERIAELEATINPASFDKYLVGQLKDPDLAEQYAKAIVRDSSYKELYDKANEYLTDTKSAIARRDEKIADLRKVYGECKDAIALRDEIIARLKEDGERLAKLNCHCHDTRGMTFLDDNYHTPDCPITLHRALMKELE